MSPAVGLSRVNEDAEVGPAGEVVSGVHVRVDPLSEGRGDVSGEVPACGEACEADLGGVDAILQMMVGWQLSLQLANWVVSTCC